ncbi:MAG TPA: hypothetical protein PKD19_03550 [Candidatus Saccharibacteria bacterium]|jgi:Fe2+ transport system protein B|nr:hypothetical protein [Candidatus Saccharibacteria bacterium]HMR38466.1 hypothetical protein [Candidatus Saccharibacteria bacterium]
MNERLENKENNVELSELRKEAEQGRDRIAEKLEQRNPENTVDNQAEVESAKHEALETAQEAKQERAAEKTKEETVERPKIQSKKAKKESFDRIMTDTRQKMSPASRSFSKVIHNPVVEKTSEALGSTIARPNAILAGSVSACLLVLGTYLIARNYGYPLSGIETILAFAIGWILGILYDFFRKMITGN